MLEGGFLAVWPSQPLFLLLIHQSREFCPALIHTTVLVTSVLPLAVEYVLVCGRNFSSYLICPFVWLMVGAPLYILQPASSTPHGSLLSVVVYSIQGQSTLWCCLPGTSAFIWHRSCAGCGTTVQEAAEESAGHTCGVQPDSVCFWRSPSLLRWEEDHTEEAIYPQAVICYW